MSDLQVEARNGHALCIPGVVQVIQIYLLSSCPEDRPKDLLVFSSENSGASAGGSQPGSCALTLDHRQCKMSLLLFWLYSISPSCDLKQIVLISLFTRSQACLGELSFCQHPLSSCSLAKGTPAKKKASLSLAVTAERGSLLTVSAYKQTSVLSDTDLIYFLSPIHWCYVSFHYCMNCSSGSSL